MLLPFTKMNGAGNDFVMVDNRAGQLHLSPAHIARLCDRHRGVGSDGLIAVEAAQGGADFRMRYYNADGGEAEMCGNGARCFARFAARLGGQSEQLSFETIPGRLTATLQGERVRLAMSTPRELALSRTLEAAGGTHEVHFVNTGVPHAVVFVENISGLDVPALGSALRWHEHFAPKGTNANFAQRLPDGTLAIRTYERGVEAETLACGTGVVATALLHHALHGGASPRSVRVQGGDLLEVSFVAEGEGRYGEVTLTGPADFVFEGTMEI